MKDKWTNPVTGQMYDATQIKVPGHLIFELSQSTGISGYSNGETMEEALVFELSRIYGLDCLECRKNHDALHPTHCEGIEAAVKVDIDHEQRNIDLLKDLFGKEKS